MNFNIGAGGSGAPLWAKSWQQTTNEYMASPNKITFAISQAANAPAAKPSSMFKEGELGQILKQLGGYQQQAAPVVQKNKDVGKFIKGGETPTIQVPTAPDMTFTSTAPRMADVSIIGNTFNGQGFFSTALSQYKQGE